MTQQKPRTCAWNSQRWGPVDLWMQPSLTHDVVTWFETLSHLKVFWLYVVRIWSSIYSWFQPYLGRWSSLATSLSHLSPSDCLHPVNLTWDSKLSFVVELSSGNQFSDWMLILVRFRECITFFTEVAKKYAVHWTAADLPASGWWLTPGVASSMSQPFCSKVLTWIITLKTKNPNQERRSFSILVFLFLSSLGSCKRYFLAFQS